MRTKANRNNLPINLEGTDLRNRNLCGADLRNRNLCGADLRYADLRGADLRGANLICADLRDAKLNAKTNLTGARVYGMYGLLTAERICKI